MTIWVATLLMATSLAAAPADFAGTWKVTYDGPSATAPKTVGSMIFALTVDGDRVTGMADIGSWPGIAPIANGKVEADRISFTARGYLPSTTGIPTCVLEGALSGEDLVIRLSYVRNRGETASGRVWVFRGGKLDDEAAKAARMKALRFLSGPRRLFPDMLDSKLPDPLTPEQLADHPALDAVREEQARTLSRMVAEWETARNHPLKDYSEAHSTSELDRLVAFYNTPLGQSLVATVPHGAPEIRAVAAQFVARQ